jgi:hypothetical protein
MAAHAVVETIADPNDGLVTMFNRDPALAADALSYGGGYGNGITLTNPYNKPVLGGERTTFQMQRASNGFIDRFAGPGSWRPKFR